MDNIKAKLGGAEDTLVENIKPQIRILIVDDLAQVRNELAIMLKLAGQASSLDLVVVGEAQNGSQAIEQAINLHPDVILMDLEMPILDGYHATQSIKLANPSVFIVILSIHSDPISRQNAFHSGADAFVEKGAPLNQLLQAIRGIRNRS
jgi:DNA-binding NarL/FixJ family response regulator